MFANLKIRSLSGWTMAIFGALAFLFGALGILFPEIVLALLGFVVIPQAERAAGDYTLVFVTASSMASFNIGIYYLLAALNDMKRFYLWTVPFRMVTFTVFSLAVLRGIAPPAFFSVGVTELVGAVATGAALYYERRKSTLPPALAANKSQTAS